MFRGVTISDPDTSRPKAQRKATPTSAAPTNKRAKVVDQLFGDDTG
jgi:hypothetical protein